MVGPCLGEGGFAVVYKANDKTKEKLPWAMKIMAYPSGKNKKQVDSLVRYMKNEIHAMVTLRHPNIVRCANKSEQDNYPFRGKKQKIVIMQLEFYNNGDIFELLFYTGKPFSTQVARTYYIQLMDAMDSCHKKGIVHRDIKLQNFFLDQYFCLKLGDFGLCRVFNKNSGMGLSENDRMTTYWAGTKGYQCPEMLKHKTDPPVKPRPYTASCDIFSCGVALFIMLTGCEPGDPRKGPNYRRFWRKHSSAPASLRNDPDAQDLLMQVLAYNPKYRATIRGIMNHNFVKREPMLIGQALRKQMQPHRAKALAIKAKQKTTDG